MQLSDHVAALIGLTSRQIPWIRWEVDPTGASTGSVASYNSRGAARSLHPAERRPPRATEEGGGEVIAPDRP